METFQTINDFLDKPFGEKEEKSKDFERKFSELDSNRKIKVVGLTQVEDDYLLHLTIGSKTNPTESYDVVLLFFTDDNSIKKEITFKNYYVKFFSNSPSFIYQYAVLYKQNGFLIDMLYDKLDEKYKDTVPDKVNKDHKLSYDSSIYCACRYLQNHGGYFNKYLNGASHKRSEQFFREIKDFSDVKMINDIRNMDKKIDKELAENKKKSKELKRNSRGKTSSTKYTKTVKASKSTLSSGNAKTKIVRPSKGIKTRKIKPR